MRAACMIAVVALLTATAARAADIDWTKVDQALGKAGANLPEGVHKVGLPRTDLHVTVDGIALEPAFALGGWLAFKPMGNRAMVMGDLVLAESEVNPVMTTLLADGISITALHNHLLALRRHNIEVTAVHNHMLDDQPHAYFVHFWANGDATKLAQGLRATLDRVNVARR